METLASMGRDHECVFTDYVDKLFFLEFDGISTLTLYPMVTLSGVKNVKMMRNGSYTLV